MATAYTIADSLSIRNDWRLVTANIVSSRYEVPDDVAAMWAAIIRRIQEREDMEKQQRKERLSKSFKEFL